MKLRSNSSVAEIYASLVDAKGFSMATSELLGAMLLYMNINRIEGSLKTHLERAHGATNVEQLHVSMMHRQK